MKREKQINNFERNLPITYKEILHIDGTKKSFGIIFNLIAIGVFALFMGLAFLLLRFSEGFLFYEAKRLYNLEAIIFIFALCLYIILHELVHGIAYKAETGEKLSFGIAWSCAFCGVPDIFVYRKTAIVALAAPLTVFGILFTALSAVTYFVNPIYFMLSMALTGMHFGGCVGDIYCLIILCRFRDKRLLVRDTGPEQFFYLPIKEAESSATGTESESAPDTESQGNT